MAFSLGSFGRWKPSSIRCSWQRGRRSYAIGGDGLRLRRQDVPQELDEKP
ncbi:hypothetical protein F2Q68_00011644 [Brassica cretica]|uniref:Uncharacterized protein n=1 Tax=Brassica cretica TaxID=69181 RepID=A0A8S9KZJ2_BRACR|nr:hypothetical protein F2Q68_00011644 [Brassica cretica]